MARPIPLGPVVFGRGDDPSPKNLLPPAVHRHAGREWVLARSDPSSQPETIAGSIGRQRPDRSDHTGRHLLTRLIPLAAHHDVGFAGLGQLLHHEGLFDFNRLDLLFQFSQGLFLLVRQLGVARTEHQVEAILQGVPPGDGFGVVFEWDGRAIDEIDRRLAVVAILRLDRRVIEERQK